MQRKFYDLVGADDARFSPYCWRARLALAHKGVAVASVPCRFTDKELIAFSGQGKVPVLVDGEQVVSDSWAIACYLERTYPAAANLFGGEYGESLAYFVNAWDDTQLKPPLIRMIIKDVFDRVHPDDAEYFRRTREAAFGTSLEAMHAERDRHFGAWQQALAPLRQALGAYPFLCGEQPAYADYCLFGTFQWARLASPLALLQADDPVYAWRERMLDRFDGLARGFAAAA